MRKVKKRCMQQCVVKAQCSFNLVRDPNQKVANNFKKVELIGDNIVIVSICRSYLLFARARKLEFPNLYPVAVHFDPVYG